MKDKQSKKITLTIISIALVLITVVGVTYSFFNYTRTGLANTIRTGRIAFNSTQDGTINLTNIFPIDPEETGIMDDTTKVGTIAITVTGDTSYDNGVEYLVSAANVSNTVGTGANQKTIPISISATASGTLGTEDENYFDNRDTATSHIYKVLAKDTISNNDQLMVGYIANNATGINGTITIKAYIDKDKIAISDTYNGSPNTTYEYGTTSTWVSGRTVLTTSEWNSLNSSGISFQVKVEANEGIWVEESLSTNLMGGFPTVISNEKANIKEIYFNKMNASVMQVSYNNATVKADLTSSSGKVLAWLETDTVDNTKYIMYIASDGETYLPSNCGNFFAGFSNLEKIEFNNINTSNVTIMGGFFGGNRPLTTIDLSKFDMSNVTITASMFSGWTNLTTIYVSNTWDVSNVTNSSGMFNVCSSLKGGGIPQTTYDENHIDKEYARIDGGANSSTPGYLTLKTN